MVASVQKDAKRRLETVGGGGVRVTDSQPERSFIFNFVPVHNLNLGFKLRHFRVSGSCASELPTLVFVLGSRKVQVSVRP